MMDKVSSSNNNKCALCGKILPLTKQEEFGTSKREEIIIDGIRYCFDAKDCATMFKRFKSVYGNKFDELLGQEQYISDPFWNKVIPSEQEIREIEKEESSKSEENIILQIIRDPAEVQKLGFELIRSAKDEVLIIFSTANAFHIQEHVGGIQLLGEAITTKKQLNIRILTPTDERIKEISSELRHQLKKIEVRHIEESLQSKVTVLVADRKYSLAVELKDDTKNSVHEVLGFATYSNSKSTVISYVSIFESLWKQVELIEQVTKLSEKLKEEEKMHKEFINIAAHELRSPIQPIVGLAEILSSKKEMEIAKQEELLSVIIRNAKRLKELTENILDITRIENQSLTLHKELVDIDDLIANALEDVKTQVGYKHNIKLIYNDSRKKSPLFVEADRGRLTQVISNLLSNAIKFTKEGTITVVTEEKRSNNIDLLFVRVKDTGTGINQSIMPILFKKFATRSEKGMGLGLFVCKSIIEAHGGKIWAENNADGKGSTFTFSMPLLSTK